MSKNLYIIIGRLGADPKEVGNGGTVKFAVATTDRYKTKEGEKREETDWHNVVCFGQLAGFAIKYLKKGDLVYVEGKSKTRSYEKEGHTFYTTELKADVLTALGAKHES